MNRDALEHCVSIHYVKCPGQLQVLITVVFENVITDKHKQQNLFTQI